MQRKIVTRIGRIAGDGTTGIICRVRRNGYWSAGVCHRGAAVRNGAARRGGGQADEAEKRRQEAKRDSGESPETEDAGFGGRVLFHEGRGVLELLWICP